MMYASAEAFMCLCVSSFVVCVCCIFSPVTRVKRTTLLCVSNFMKTVTVLSSVPILYTDDACITNCSTVWIHMRI